MEPVWDQTGTNLETKLGTKMEQKWNQMNQNGTKMKPECHQIGTRRGPKWNQNGSKMGPKWDQKGTEMEPKWNQNNTKREPKWNKNGTRRGPKWYQNGTKMGPEGDQNGTKMRPEGDQDGPLGDIHGIRHRSGTGSPKSVESQAPVVKTGWDTFEPAASATRFWDPLRDSLKNPTRTL